METLEKAKFVPKEKAVEVVNRVFDKCYADLEPLGRRPINAKDMKRAYNERYLCENWINMDQKERQNCEINVMKALSSSPRIRLLVQALNNSGCPFLPSRHIDCRWVNEIVFTVVKVDIFEEGCTYFQTFLGHF